MRLIYEKSKAEVCPGDIIATRRGELVQVESVTKPADKEPTGSVALFFLKDGLPFGVEQHFAPAVICAEWTDGEVSEPCKP